jgi:ABC-type Fe3+ transport system permease subunit
MEDSGTEDNGMQNNGMKNGTAQQYADEDHRSHRGLARYARPALIAGCVIAVVCVALLVIIFFLDSFNATIYSVGGKDVKDATDEALAIRETYAAARLGGIIFLVIGVVLAAAGGLVLYRHRNEPGRDDEDENGEDVDFEDLAGQ